MAYIWRPGLGQQLKPGADPGGDGLAAVKIECVTFPSPYLVGRTSLMLLLMARLSAAYTIIISPQ